MGNQLLKSEVFMLFEYGISGVCFVGNIIKVFFHPMRDAMVYCPGQYCKLQSNSGFKSFSIVNLPSESGLIECHLRDSHRNRALIKQLCEQKTLSISGPFGSEYVRDDAPTVFLAEGIGLAAIQPMINSHGSFQFPSLVLLKCGESDIEYASQIVDTWKQKHSSLLIKMLGEEYHKFLTLLISFKSKHKTVNCYFAGTPDMKSYIENNFVQKYSSEVKFFSDI